MLGVYPKITGYIKEKYSYYDIKKIPNDPLEDSKNVEESKKYLKYAKASKKIVTTVGEIVGKLVSNKMINTVIDVSLGSGIILETLISNGYKDVSFVGFEKNDTRREKIKMKIKKDEKIKSEKMKYEVWGEFNRKELTKIEDKYRGICLICDPPWGSWKILNYDKSLLGFGGFGTMGALVNGCKKIKNFIFILPKNYCFEDDLIYRVKGLETINLYKTGNSSFVVYIKIE